MQIYNIAIIGCGSIGALKPDHIDYPGSQNILTHANAVDRHPQAELVALVDSNGEQLRKAKTKWQPRMAVRTFEDIILNGNKYLDIAIVSVPTKYHYEVIKELGKYSEIKLIIAEKPFCQSSKQAQELATDYSKPILVDYIRRFAPEYKNIKRQIDLGTFGAALNCRVLYTRGLFHEGCHALDLMRYFFGECNHSEKSRGIEIIDRDDADPSAHYLFSFEKCCPVTFHPCDGRKYGIFEIDICFEKTRLRFIDNGLFVEQYPINSENEWGHKSLDYNLVNVIRKETGLNTALYYLLDNAIKFLDGEEPLICTSQDAVEVHKSLNKIKGKN